ncbi:ABC transporter permease [Hutsoniella sourekii]
MIKLELIKIKIVNLTLTALIIPFLANIFGLLNYLGNPEILTHQWQSLWTQVSLFYFMFFYVLLIGIIVAGLWSVEHKAGLKLIRTSPQPNIAFVIAKSVLAFIIVALTQMYFLLLFLGAGKFICHFNAIDLSLYIEYISLSIFFAILMILIFSAISIRFKSLAVVTIIAVLISIVGFLTSAKQLFLLSYLSLKMNYFIHLSMAEFSALTLIGLLESILSIYIAKRWLTYEV